MNRSTWKVAVAVPGLWLGLEAHAAPDDLDRRPPQEQVVPDARNPNAQTVSRADQAFLSAATSDGLAAIELGKLAQKLSLSAGVRGYGRRLVEDHQRANAQLEELATRLGVAMVKAGRAPRELGALPSLEGDDFDRAFLRHLVGFNERGIAKIKLLLVTSRNPEVKEWAEGLLPMLEEHLQIAQDLRRDRVASR